MIEYILGYGFDSENDIKYYEVPIELLRIAGTLELKNGIDIAESLAWHDWLDLAGYDVMDVKDKIYNKKTGRLELGILDGEYNLELEVKYIDKLKAFRIGDGRYIKTQLAEAIIDKSCKDYKNILKYKLAGRLPDRHYISGRYYIERTRKFTGKEDCAYFIDAEFLKDNIVTVNLNSIKSLYTLCNIKVDFIFQNKDYFRQCSMEVGRVVASKINLAQTDANIKEVNCSEINLINSECTIHTGKGFSLSITKSKVYLREGVKLDTINVSDVYGALIYIEGNHQTTELDKFIDDINFLSYSMNVGVYVNGVGIELD